ncbi:hypothetical protein BC835DRAFT_1282196 [Cytidiella melzeri]|nr:hypothetical protein BC835DRAFT_1282196 [Cytidiella melzeri]
MTATDSLSCLPPQRTLVFDYLCHGSYTSTARAFLRDSMILRTSDDELMDVDDGAAHSPVDLASEERLRLAQLRRDPPDANPLTEIRVQILCGKVDDAIALLKTYFPAVLSQDPHDHSMHTSTTSNDTFTYIAPRSVDPTHLLLDLRILGFIEAARTIPLPYHPPGSSASSPPPSSHTIPTSPRTGGGHSQEYSEPNVQQQLLLHKAQKLYSDANCLAKADDRALYLKELANVGALLAYRVPEDSPLAAYLSQDRREEMAEQIDGAILYHTGDLAASRIELAARHTSVMWNWMNAEGIHLPPPAKWPMGVQLPPDTLHSSHTKASDSAAASEETPSVKKSPDKEGEVRVLHTLSLLY